MSYIDKTYIDDYQQFKEVRDWCKGKIVEIIPYAIKKYVMKLILNKIKFYKVN